MRRRRPVEIDALGERSDLGPLLNYLGLHGTGIEIGVQQGLFAATILRYWTGKQLILVDPWAEAGADYEDESNVPQATHDAFLAETRARVEIYGKRAVIWRMTSEQASSKVDSCTLDFAYIDARHDEASVSEDLGLWWSKIRPGGIIAGHDYFDGHLSDGVFGVRTAVDRFFGERGLPVHATKHDAPWTTWVVQKPADRVVV